MGDVEQNKSKDMRHRSCCSVIDGLRSVRKLDGRASEAEVFVKAESRCDQLQQKISDIKFLKKKTSKRRSSQGGTSSVSIISKNPKIMRRRTARSGRSGKTGKGATDLGIGEDQEPVVETRVSELHLVSDEAGGSKMDGANDDAPQAAETLQSRVSGVRTQRRHYEVDTESSRMRRASRVALQRQLPFVIGNTKPSYNIAVNVQTLLNSLKTQQMPRGIPPIFTNHTGLKNFLDFVRSSAPVAGRGVRSTPARAAKGSSVAGRSFARALSLLCAGDGPLPRYLRSLNTQEKGIKREEPGAGATDEGRRELVEYAALYRELKRVDARIDARRGERRDPALELHRRQIAAQLLARAGRIEEILKSYEKEASRAQTLAIHSRSHSLQHNLEILID